MEYLAREIREEVGLVTLRLNGGIGGKKKRENGATCLKGKWRRK
jgi:hypothetical protein